MKKVFLTVIVLLTITACSEPNPFLDKIKEKVKEDALGAEMNYQNISFNWVDTLTVGKQIEKLSAKYNDGINTILNNNYYSEEILNKEALIKLRGFENRVRSAPKGFKNYEEFAFANRDASSFISDLCNQFEETDKILNDWDNIEKGNLNLIRVATWFYEREDSFNGKKRGDWDAVLGLVDILEELKTKKDKLLGQNTNEIIEYKAYNVYKINNPLLNGTEVEVKRHFIFDKELNIIRTED